MRTFRFAVLLPLAAGSVAATPSAFADGVSFVLLNPTQTIAPGQTVIFDATVTATPGNTKISFSMGTLQTSRTREASSS